ncbi:diaminopimelate epimerase [Thermanaeromonas toyohensis ToBE]|uniref:Diaminopimelate epimerase n=2 Tax=Thermanaeromonas TaxID=202949 RepID=A0A1W1VME4_9FIRM|nr:diaminopimelate epimerase [Thermanaeromonas toyohensis ToBE]
MGTLRFTKMHGLGNDFVLVNGFRERIERDMAELARRLCDRRFGVGSDGLIFLLPSQVADLKMRMFNPDGSEAEMCGNGIRCLARLAYEEGLVQGRVIRVETLAGIVVPELILEGDKVSQVRVDMGEPRFFRREIPMLGEGDTAIEAPLEVNGEIWEATCLSMGNPHCVIFVPRIEEAPVTELGPKLEYHPLFPQRTNVEFIEVQNPGEIKMRVWERGAGETLACGSGACAAVVASALTGRTKRKVVVHLPAGDLQIEWAANNHVFMSGPAARVFEGLYYLET